MRFLAIVLSFVTIGPLIGGLLALALALLFPNGSSAPHNYFWSTIVLGAFGYVFFSYFIGGLQAFCVGLTSAGYLHLKGRLPVYVPGTTAVLTALPFMNVGGTSDPWLYASAFLFMHVIPALCVWKLLKLKLDLN